MGEVENYLELRVGGKFCKVEIGEDYIDAIDRNDPESIKDLVARLVRAVQIGRSLDKQKKETKQ